MYAALPPEIAEVAWNRSNRFCGVGFALTLAAFLADEKARPGARLEPFAAAARIAGRATAGL
jgi:hypothetical protein